jgi:ComF family protein
LAPEAVRAIGLSHYAALASLCPMCRMATPEFERAVAYGVYEDELREAVHLLKYNRVRSLARPLGAMLASAVLTLEGAAARELVVVPVPLYSPKERERGYDQAALLASSMVQHLRRLRPEWTLTLERGAMRRVRDTRSQFGLMPHERRANLRGAFRVRDAESVAGREVLLVDDIMTTGATARECSRVLREAGAAKVWVATVARAQRLDFVAAWDQGSGSEAPRRASSILH